MPRLSAIILLILFMSSASVKATSIQWLSDKNKENVILFVHGFLGDPLETFRKGPNSASWPELLLSDTRPMHPLPPTSEYAIGIADYESSSQSQLSLVQFAERLKTDLVDAGLFEAPQRNVTLVAHSMGGLLIEQLLMDRDFMRKADGKIKSVFLIAVPANGSPIAETAEKFSYFFSPRVLFDLTPIDMNSLLQRISVDFREYFDEKNRGNGLPRIYCAYETRPVSKIAEALLGFGTVVSQVYAEQRCDHAPRPEDADHIEIVKPSSIEDSIYGWVRGRLLETSGLIFEKCEKASTVDEWLYCN